jgi:hypothetical protein
VGCEAVLYLLSVRNRRIERAKSNFLQKAQALDQGDFPMGGDLLFTTVSRQTACPAIFPASIPSAMLKAPLDLADTCIYK